MSQVFDWTEWGSKTPIGPPDFSAGSFMMGSLGLGSKLPLRRIDSYLRYASHCSTGGDGWLS